MLVVGWGWLEGDPVAEAQLAVDLCRRYDLDGYIANAEVAYEGWATNAGKSRVFVQEFRRLAPRAPLAVSGLGAATAPWVRELDYWAWLDAGAVFMPQMYPNEFGDVYSVANCLAHADRMRDASDRPRPIPRRLVVPTLGTYSSRFPYSAAAYAEELAAAGTIGFNVFLGETASDDDYRAFGRAIAERGIALR